MVQEIDISKFSRQDNPSLIVHDGFVLNRSVNVKDAVGRILRIGEPYRLLDNRIVRIISGNICISVNMKSYDLDAGEALLVASGTIVEITDHSDDGFVDLLGFQNPVWDGCRKVMFLGSECSSWPDVYFTLLYDTASASPFNKKAVECLIASLCARASDACGQPETDNADRTARQFAVYEEFIDRLSEEHGKHDVSHYAELLNISSNYLSRIVSQIGGGTAIDMINRSVILQAKVLLKNSDMNIENISEQLNFPNSPYFCRFFKRETGMTPTEYRKREMCRTTILSLS